MVDRSPAFRLAFPFDTKAEPTLIYKNEIATTYMAQPAGEGEAGGLHVINFTGDQATPVPASPAYLAAISKFNPLPSELTLDQLKPVLKAKGLDVDALLPQLLPNLTPDDTNALLALAAAPIKLQYLFSFSGADSVEPSTGSIVEVHDVVETLYVAPDPTVLPKLREVLARYPNVPAAVAGRHRARPAGRAADHGLPELVLADRRVRGGRGQHDQGRQEAEGPGHDDRPERRCATAASPSSSSACSWP